MKNTNARYHIYSEQTADGETMRMEMAGDCNFYRQDGTYYIEYQEDDPEHSSGCTTQIEVGEELVKVGRTGPTLNTELRYQAGRTHSCAYELEFGTIVMESTAQSVDAAFTETGGRLSLCYLLDIGGTKSQNHLTIEVKTKEAENV